MSLRSGNLCANGVIGVYDCRFRCVTVRSEVVDRLNLVIRSFISCQKPFGGASLLSFDVVDCRCPSVSAKGITNRSMQTAAYQTAI